MQRTDPIRTLVVDDEAPARQRVVDLLAPLDEMTIVGEAASGAEAVRRIREAAPELVFLDVQMPKLTGLDVVRRLDPERRPLIVFVTAYDEYAIPAFDAHALDYLLKPFTDERFHATIERATRVLYNNELISFQRRLQEVFGVLDRSPARGGYSSRIAVRDRGTVTLVPVSEIDYIMADGDYVRLRCGSKSVVHRTTLQAVELELSPASFVRIHRSYIVATDRIVSIEPWFRGDQIARLRDGSKLRVSRTYRERLHQALGMIEVTEGPTP